MGGNKRKKELDSLLIGEYEKDVTFECPVRGTVTQRVTVKRYKTIPIESRFIINIDDVLEKLDTPIDAHADEVIIEEKSTEDIEHSELEENDKI